MGDFIEHKGKKYARVSAVIRPYCNFVGISEEVLKEKARIGTLVHEMIAEDIEDSFPITQAMMNPSDIEKTRPYFESYQKWKKEVCPNFLNSEQRYFCDKLMITGQIDSLIYIENTLNLPTLIDFKCSAKESPDTWTMQGHLYSYLLSTNGLVCHPRYMFIKLDKTGALPQVFSYLWSANVMAKCLSSVKNFYNIP